MFACLESAMRSGRIEWMAYALECGAKWSSWSASWVVEKNGLPGLLWARRKGCKLARALMEGLLRRGDFDAALCLHEEGGMPLPKSACTCATHETTLRHSNGCANAARRGTSTRSGCIWTARQRLCCAGPFATAPPCRQTRAKGWLSG
jgi:hypothetical protein